MGFWGATWAAWRQFWQTLFPPPAQEPGHLQWSDHLVRRMRYGLLWSFYDQTVYFGRYGDTLKREFNLYKHIRPILNCCGRIVEFHVDHIQGGHLDPELGDGSGGVETCLPFIPAAGARPALRGAAAATLGASNWFTRKGIYNRYGACLGDVGLEAVADTKRGVVRLRVVHPAELTRVTKDPYGNVKSYNAVRWELDPEDPQGVRVAQYKEEVVNDNGTVVYRTYKDGTPYPWPGTPGSEWTFRWGFVPLVLVQHIDLGNEWGTAELQGALYKVIERDDQSSNTGDAGRKYVNPPWLLTGATLPPPPPAGRNPWSGDPFAPNEYFGPPTAAANGAPNVKVQLQDRYGIPILTSNSLDARMTPLVCEIPIDDLDGHVRMITDALEQDYPELAAFKVGETGDAASGVALDKARQRAADKVHQRRVAYDDALKRALQMALTMGGDLGFPAYQGLGDGAWEAGGLDFRFGDRPVFRPTPSEKAADDERKSRGTQALAAAGVPTAAALRLAGYRADEVEDAGAAIEAEQARQERIAAKAAKAKADAEAAARDRIETEATRFDPAAGNPPPAQTGGDMDVLP